MLCINNSTVNISDCEHEEKFEEAGSWILEEDEDEEYVPSEIMEVEAVERTQLNENVEYIQRWVCRTKIQILQNSSKAMA